MLETTAGRLTGRLLQPPRPVSQEVLKATGEEEDLGELSDSPSSGPSNSRPTTPNEGLIVGRPSTSSHSIDKSLQHIRSIPNLHHPLNTMPSSTSSDSAHGVRLSEETSAPRRSSDSDGPYGVASKAERLLGLVPGTLQHALVSLDYARDEVRRLATAPQTRYVPWTGGKYGSGDESDGASISDKRTLTGTVRDRARRALSVSFQPGQGAQVPAPKQEAVPNVVIGVGGAEEEMMRERRRKVADGVLYWQKQVARLEQEEMEEMKMGRKKNSGRGTTRKR